jgi:hypothetical protein
MKKSIALIIVVVLIAGMAACSKKSTSDKPSNTSYVGTWTRIYLGENLKVVIKNDGTSSGTWGTISLPSGHYTCTGNVLSFTDDVCPNAGKYTFTISNDVLTMTLVSDSCDGRYQLVPGTYTRVK